MPGHLSGLDEMASSVLLRYPRQNKSSLSSCAASCKGNTETHCVQTTVFLILTAGLAGPAGRFARKSLAANAGRGRLAASLQEGLPPLLKQCQKPTLG